MRESVSTNNTPPVPHTKYVFTVSTSPTRVRADAKRVKQHSPSCGDSTAGIACNVVPTQPHLKSRALYLVGQEVPAAQVIECAKSVGGVSTYHRNFKCGLLRR